MLKILGVLSSSATLCTCVSTGTKSPNADLVDAQYAAYNSRDIDAFMSFYAASSKICTLPSNVCFEGEAQIRAHFTKVFSRMTSLEARISKRTVDQNYVLDWEHVKAVTESGETLDLSGISVYRIENGKIVSLTIFTRDVT